MKKEKITYEFKHNKGIYMLTLPTGLSYIGKSINLMNRLKCYNKKTGYKEQRLLYKEMLNNNFNFKFEVLEYYYGECNIELKQLETYYINILNTQKPFGLNINR